jgi:hypothetical protein
MMDAGTDGPKSPVEDLPGDDYGKTGGGAKRRDPVRIGTLLVLGLCVVFFFLYLRADRVMPYSDQARSVASTVPLAPQGLRVRNRNPGPSP